MLSVILIWLYMAVTSFLLGFGVLEGLRTFVHHVELSCQKEFRHTLHKQDEKKAGHQHIDAYLICGLTAATVYAQIFSLFAPVALGANIVLTGICLIIFLISKNKLAVWLHGRYDRTTALNMLLWCGLIFLYAYGTSRGIPHYDTGLYHAQSIRWIETFGAVKGLGNLHCRLAYNSSSFALSALYSMAFLGGQSFHTCVGFLAMILAGVSCELRDAFVKRKLCASSFARVMCFYYLFAIFDEMVSPASDYFMVLIAFYIVIRWMDLLENGEIEIFPYAMLSVLCVFLLTVKLSAALIILLVIKPAVMLIRQKKWQETGIYLILGAVTALPFLIRNVILSGWLIYPFTAIDLFGVDWKIPKGTADADAKEIQVWGRGYADVSRYNIPIKDWLPDWFAALGRTEQLLVLIAVFSSVIVLARLIWKLLHGRGASQWNNILLESVLTICFWFWMLTSPLMRYGCVYVYLISAVLWGDIFMEHLTRGGAVLILLGLFLVYKLIAFGREMTVSHVNDYWLYQQDYEQFETESYEIEGITFYVPVEGDRAGYHSFPSSPVKAQIKLRGDTLREGFAYE